MVISKLAPIPTIIHTARQDLAKLNEDASRFSIDAINRFKSIQLQVADLQAQLDVFGDFAGLATGAPSAIMPDDPAIIGVSTLAARADHQHAIVAAAPPIGIGASNSEGAASSFARSDHNHTIRETSGPQDLTVGSILNGESVRRISGAVLAGRLIRTDRNNGTATSTVVTPADVSAGLTVASLTAGEAYGVIWVLHYNTAATTTGLMLSVNYTGTAANVRFGVLMASAATTMFSASATALDTLLGQAGVGPGGTNRIALVFCRMTATTAGDLALRFASGVAASAVNISTSSFYFAIQE